MINKTQNDTLIKSLCENKIVAIIRGVPEQKIVKVVEAVFDGGIKNVEITFDHSSKELYNVTAREIAAIKSHFGNSLFIGAGTVIDTKDVLCASEAGAQFLISPNTSKSVITLTKKLGLVSIPGAFTPTEICNAYEYGADFVKVFPIVSNTAQYIKALKAPLKHIPLMAVGGITVQNAKEVMQAGAVGIGIGSSVVNAAELSNESFDYGIIKERAAAFVAAIK